MEFNKGQMTEDQLKNFCAAKTDIVIRIWKQWRIVRVYPIARSKGEGYELSTTNGSECYAHEVDAWYPLPDKIEAEDE